MFSAESHREAANEAYKNAKAWLDDAMLLAERGTPIHARALQNFAIEEIAKAYACWMAGYGIIPLNHPYVDGMKSIFKNHTMINIIYKELEHSILHIDLFRAGKVASPNPTEGVGVLFTALAHIFGPMGTEKRSEWMYVNIIRKKGGEFSVHSPLDSDAGSVKYGLQLVGRTLKRVGILLELTKRPDFDKIRSRIRKEMEQQIQQTVDNPIWELE